MAFEWLADVIAWGAETAAHDSRLFNAGWRLLVQKKYWKQDKLKRGVEYFYWDDYFADRGEKFRKEDAQMVITACMPYKTTSDNIKWVQSLGIKYNAVVGGPVIPDGIENGDEMIQWVANLLGIDRGTTHSEPSEYPTAFAGKADFDSPIWQNPLWLEAHGYSAGESPAQSSSMQYSTGVKIAAIAAAITGGAIVVNNSMKPKKRKKRRKSNRKKGKRK